jgi:Fe-S-cluster containining protein
MASKVYCAECNEHLRNRQTRYPCMACGAVCCASHIHAYVDGNNAAITRHAPNLCKACYVERYAPFVKVRTS